MADSTAPSLSPAVAPTASATPPSGVVGAGPPGSGGPPFGVEFFASVLTERVRTVCEGAPEQVPVVELHLADGLTADVCHIPVLAPQWIVALVYRDKETCKEMDTMFIPYALVTRVTVSTWHRSQRLAGFNLPVPV